jgi:Domain of unknown function (DUF5668)
MNCAVHPEAPVAAYCRTCGKALCAACARDVRGVIYCEDCIAARVQGTLPAVPPGTPGATTVVPAGPNPALSVILAIFLPFGAGAVYTGQYAKGLAHMVIFVFLVAAISTGLAGPATPIFGIMMGFFYFYQIIDAYRSAKAIQLGQPPPDPFGLGRAFGAGETLDASKVPVGAIVLIGVGVLFLLHNAGWFRFHVMGKLWPLILIAIGVWLFMRRTGRA